LSFSGIVNGWFGCFSLDKSALTELGNEEEANVYVDKVKTMDLKYLSIDRPMEKAARMITNNYYGDIDLFRSNQAEIIWHNLA
jgi:hypothetical protein